jgi:hypothetical protein
MRTAASIKSLTQIKDVTPEMAKQVRNVWKNMRGRIDAQNEINKLIDTHGVEFLGFHKRTGCPIYYCNAGDGYTGTVMFAQNRMYVGCWADLVERNLVRDAACY